MLTKVPKYLRILSLCIVLFVSATVSLSLPKTAYADPGCVDGGVYVVFARGSGEKIGGIHAETFATSITKSLKARGLNTAFVELGNLGGATPKDRNPPADSDAYPAVGGPPYKMAWQQVSGKYGGSVEKGTNELVNHLNYRVMKCPKANETFVLGGYSQGADVVGWALERIGKPGGWSLSQQARNQIGYVALYGDPKFYTGSGDGNCAVNNTPPSWVKTWLWCDDISSVLSPASAYSEGVLTALGYRDPYIPKEFEGRVGSWCDYKDFVCTSNTAYALNGGSHTYAYIEHGGRLPTAPWIKASVPEITAKAIQKRNALNPLRSALSVPVYIALSPLNTVPPKLAVPVEIIAPSAVTFVSRSPSTLNSFYTFNGELVNRWWDTSINQWVRQSWQANATGKPAVAFRHTASGQCVSVFFRTKAAGIDEMYMAPDGSWHGPFNHVASGVSSDPAAAARDGNHMEIVWVNNGGALLRRGWDVNIGWMGIGTIMAADVTSHPVLVARDANNLDGFVIKNNRNIVHFANPNGEWRWEDWPASAIGSPAVALVNGETVLDGVYKKDNGHVADRYWHGQSGWQIKDWQAMLATDPAATALNGIGYAVYVEVGGNLVVRNLKTGASNSVFNGASKGYTPSITTREGALEVAFWADEGSLKRLRVEVGSLTASVSETITQMP